MNILVLNWRDIVHPQAGGAEIHFTEIFRRLVNRGHSVTLLTTKFYRSPKHEIVNGIEIFRLANNFFFNWQAPFLIKKLMKKKQFHCIIDDVNKLPFFSSKWFSSKPVGALFHHLFGHTIFEETSKPFGLYIYTMERLFGWGYRSVPCCAVSESTARELIDLGVPAENMDIIENSVDSDHFSPDPSIKKENATLLYVGRLKRYKRIDLIFEAMQILIKKGQTVSFVIAGSGDDLPYLVRRTKELKIQEHVVFKGRVSEEEKIDLLRRATIFVNPSLKEGWGITNIEASACGTAVIANNAPGLRDSVDHGKTGLLFKENDPHSLACCIEEVLNDSSKRISFQRQGRDWALKFSWDDSAERMERWIEKIVTQKV
ncbi:glycosyltransferase family 4 protein [Chitinispirillales bacterium ANBcel5]|uniref:glycosyltransferase family 4 protein n=1 Tax=Cellulosispirillum alkaliphilum TaxID=3039283 RepID=UPI002A52458D|nr:glycosyltransferase family 4 protein [Chitinispirillales bacterium ANBcel5]